MAGPGKTAGRERDCIKNSAMTQKSYLLNLDALEQKVARINTPCARCGAMVNGMELVSHITVCPELPASERADFRDTLSRLASAPAEELAVAMGNLAREDLASFVREGIAIPIHKDC